MSKSAEKLAVSAHSDKAHFACLQQKLHLSNLKLKYNFNLQGENLKKYTVAQRRHSFNQTTMQFQLQQCLVQTSGSTKIVTTNFEVTYPLLRLLLLGPILRSLGQRDGEERERIFKRPPLPWRESRGATGVKTPDNQSGILKFHRLHRLKTKTRFSRLEKTNGSAFVNNKVCCSNVLQIYSAT